MELWSAAWEHPSAAWEHPSAASSLPRGGAGTLVCGVGAHPLRRRRACGRRWRPRLRRRCSTA